MKLQTPGGYSKVLFCIMWLILCLAIVVVTHGSFVQQRRDAEDVVAADVCHGALDDALAALQAAVALEGVPGHLAFDPIEHVHLPDPGDQHQLCSREERVVRPHPSFCLEWFNQVNTNSTNRVDECVRVVDATAGRVLWQAEADRVVLAFLKAYRPHQKHVSETRSRSEVRR